MFSLYQKIIIQPPALIRNLYPHFIWRIPVNEKIIYLTFDDGPIPETTPWILNQLDAYNAKATFFCIGENVKKYPKYYQKILTNGHKTGNHTYNHTVGMKSKNKQYFENIQKAGMFIDSKLFRPPHGRIKFSQAKYLRKNTNLQIIMWDVLSMDFDNSRSPEQVYKNVIHYSRPGSIIVFHDSLKAQKKLQYTLPRCLKFFSEKKYRFEALV